MALREAIVGYALNALWQVPMLALTGSMCGRIVRRFNLDAEHRVHVVALLLATVVPALSFSLDLRDLPIFLRGPWPGAAIGPGGVEQTAGTVRIAGNGLHLPVWLVTSLFVIYLSIVVAGAVRLGIALLKLRRLRFLAEMDLPASWPQQWETVRNAFGVCSATLAVSDTVTSPVAFGIRRQMVLMPATLRNSSNADLRTALAHEAAHLQRHDFAKHLLYCVASLPIAFHPATALLRQRIAESREVLCDRMAAEALGSTRDYTRSLLSLAASIAAARPAVNLQAIGIFDGNALERRVHTMLYPSKRTGRLAQAGLLTAALLIGAEPCASALALHLGVQSETAADVAPPKIIYRKPPVYPAEARATKNTLDGTVIVAVTVDKAGTPQNLRVVQSLRADYDQSAVDAVRDWRFEPATRKGEPVEIDVKLNITYSMNP